ncbi:hypothetical protein K2173_002531 [Erythroxylum novogranatense]|uniref:Sulfite exporter TauE/SafE family protein n=1 Tax=Erythroxylum novogranatense TaxID=1862640 RepID=A0AAV8TQS5_9ROSI|nr:hypothetical protein K2173_002531 [Erythroxylum novogranatense]
MPRLSDPKLLASMKRVISDVSQTRAMLRTLGPRLDHESVDTAKQKLSKTECTISEKERSLFKMIVRLEMMHDAYEKLLKDAEKRLVEIYENAKSGKGKDVVVEAVEEEKEEEDYTNPYLPVNPTAIEGPIQLTVGPDGKKKEPESNVLLTIIENMQYAVIVDVLHTEMKFGWKIVLGTIIAFIGAACGSVGGIGGGGIFVPMLTLIIGFDAKSSAAISKCIITGAAGSIVYYNLKLRHPTLDLPIIDYDLMLLLQPMLVLGICIGVALNVVFADWMITILLIIFFIATSTKSFFKGVET